MDDFSKQDLVDLIELLDKHGNSYHADYLSNLKKMDFKSDEFLKKACSVDIWGGAGSLLDQYFVLSLRSEDEIRTDEASCRALLYKLAVYLDWFDDPCARLPRSRLFSGFFSRLEKSI